MIGWNWVSSYVGMTYHLCLFLILDDRFHTIYLPSHLVDKARSNHLMFQIALPLDNYQTICFMAAPNHDSTFDEIDRLLADEEFCRHVEQLNEITCKRRAFGTRSSIDLDTFSIIRVSASQGSSLPITPSLLDTAFLNVSSVDLSQRYESKTISFICIGLKCHRSQPK